MFLFANVYYYSRKKKCEDCLKLKRLWRKISDLPPNQQGIALVLSLGDEALDAVL